MSARRAAGNDSSCVSSGSSSGLIKKKGRLSIRNLFPAFALAAIILLSYAMVAVPIPAAHALDGNLYVSSSGSDEVKRYSGSTGAFIDNFVPAGSTGLVSPVRLAFGPDGNLYVSSSFSHDIKRVNGSTGTLMNDFVAAGSGGLGLIGDFAFGPDGNLYVVNLVLGGTTIDIKRYNGTTGAFVDNFIGTSSGGPGAYASGITFGPDGNLYVGNHYFSSEVRGDVLRYNGTTGAFIDTFVPAGTGGLSNPGGPTFGPDGNLYITDGISPFTTIKRYNGTTGAFIDNFVPTGSGGLNNPAIWTFGPDGNLYVGDPLGREIRRFSGTTGAFIDNFIENTRDFFSTHSLIFGPDHNLYEVGIGDGQSTTEIRRFSGTTGAFIDKIAPGDKGLSSPLHLMFGLDGSLLVNSIGNGDVKRYNGTTGTLINNFVGASSGSTALGPDGNLYVGRISHPRSGIAAHVDRFNGTTGVSLGTFVSEGSGGLNDPTALAFGPDGNLYVASSNIIKRFSGSTGAFIDDFVAAGSSGLNVADVVTFGPDGNLYVANLVHVGEPAHDILRYNGTTGAFIGKFVPAGTGGLSHASGLTFGPDGNLYVSSQGTNEVKRYNGTTGAFIDNFVAAGSGGLLSPTGLAFAPPSLPQKPSLTVGAVDLSGKPISGVWTVIRLASDGSIAKTGFTPLTFAGETGKEYKISVANYDGKVFKHWEDASTNNIRTIKLTKDTAITATYDTGNSLRGFTSLTYTGTAEQPDLTVNALSTQGNKTLHMWAVIDPQSTDTTGTTTYKVYATNGYQNLVFDHWGDNGSTDRIRTLTIKENTAITAYYKSG